MGKLDGQVAFITGAARGQGRSHALRLASEGADIVAVDIARQLASVPYPLSTPADLAETARQVGALGRRVVASVADVRDYDALKAALDAGVAELGRLDVVVANAGIFSAGRVEEISEDAWREMIDVNLTGVWHTAKAAIPHLKAGGGGSIVITGSTSAVKGFENIAHYVAAKHGCVGLMRTLALELAPHRIRVNIVHPTSVDTDMVHNDMNYGLFAPDLPPEARTRETIVDRFERVSALPVPWIEPTDIANAVLWLASGEARFVTGAELKVDAGVTLK